MKLNVDDLIEQGLVKKKTYTDGEFAGLSVLKYAKKVFFNNLWNKDPRLVDCRGMVVDSEDNIVVWPFTKVFNLYENNTNVDRDKIVIAPRKINGFMCAVSTYKGKPIYSTTGSLDSEFAKMAKEIVEHQKFNDEDFEEGRTYLFEVCHKNDPHIIFEEFGAYLIGVRDHESGKMLSEFTLNVIADSMGFFRPEFTIDTFDKVKQESKICKHEGFMIIDHETGETLCKLKSNHYLSKKAIMRLGQAKVEGMFENPDKFKERVDEEFYSLVGFIVKTVDKEQWKSYSDQQRRTFIEKYFEEQK
jgi:hypothetical protein